MVDRWSSRAFAPDGSFACFASPVLNILLPVFRTDPRDMGLHSRNLSRSRGGAGPRDERRDVDVVGGGAQWSRRPFLAAKTLGMFPSPETLNSARIERVTPSMETSFQGQAVGGRSLRARFLNDSGNENMPGFWPPTPTPVSRPDVAGYTAGQVVRGPWCVVQCGGEATLSAS